ncbi:hypothetical protein GIB67_041621, partial [Kingdonia uniflora]
RGIDFALTLIVESQPPKPKLQLRFGGLANCIHPPYKRERESLLKIPVTITQVIRGFSLKKFSQLISPRDWL